MVRQNNDFVSCRFRKYCVWNFQRNIQKIISEYDKYFLNASINKLLQNFPIVQASLCSSLIALIIIIRLFNFCDDDLIFVTMIYLAICPKYLNTSVCLSSIYQYCTGSCHYEVFQFYSFNLESNRDLISMGINTTLHRRFGRINVCCTPPLYCNHQ